MRRLVLAAALTLSAGACCVDVASDDACVAVRGRPICQPLPREELLCSYDDTDEPPPLFQPLTTCDGTLHEGDDCPDLGFTVRCQGEYFVRPGDAC